MPSLNFLKKKRTRDDKPDPSGSQPTSPVTPTHSKPFDASAFTKSPPQTSHNTAARGSTASKSHKSTNSIREAPASAGGGPPMNPSALHQHPQAPYGLQHTPSPGQTNTPHNLPSINNLINIPQNDGEHESTGTLTIPYS